MAVHGGSWLEYCSGRVPSRWLDSWSELFVACVRLPEIFDVVPMLRNGSRVRASGWVSPFSTFRCVNSPQ